MTVTTIHHQIDYFVALKSDSFNEITVNDFNLFFNVKEGDSIDVYFCEKFEHFILSPDRKKTLGNVVRKAVVNGNLINIE